MAAVDFRRVNGPRHDNNNNYHYTKNRTDVVVDNITSMLSINIAESKPENKSLMKNFNFLSLFYRT